MGILTIRQAKFKTSDGKEFYFDLYNDGDLFIEDRNAFPENCICLHKEEVEELKRFLNEEV